MLFISDFNYQLPRELIAQYPLCPRDKSRLMIVKRKGGEIEHRIFSDIIEYIAKDDVVILNNTKVLPCRLYAQRPTGGKAEVLLLRRKEGFSFYALLKPSRLRLGERLVFNGANIYGTISAKNEIAFSAKNIEEIYQLGVMPLPPYIKRRAQPEDSVYYQTVYAKEIGAVAAPTAGLHFTEELLRKLDLSGVRIGYITLHVGLGTFKPVRCKDITKHRMEPEYFQVYPETAQLIQEARQQKKRIFAVGTTSLRALETYSNGLSSGYTDLFIYPGYNFRITDCLLTNFHLPATTLFMLVCAFAGKELMHYAYQEAINKRYRFYSYGDAMLIL
ncbi:MAG: tRNA preQ1(34) S-adenosylmethionine ribosyltransferase-isomerase QueA [Candidatus Omnitrophica bacterium]|nr:tRNA preQ1(34) S-adenosylmethionine ribosyltransferase-isomerase QueA [Candidatus Omnitrophota bacterium]